MTIPANLPTSALSIQGEQRQAKLGPGILCRGLWRHVGWDGQVYVRRVHGVLYWVAVLQCVHCGTTRVTKYEPRTWVQVGTHQYTNGPEYPNNVSREECRAKWLNSLEKILEV